MDKTKNNEGNLNAMGNLDKIRESLKHRRELRDKDDGIERERIAGLMRILRIVKSSDLSNTKSDKLEMKKKDGTLATSQIIKKIAREYTKKAHQIELNFSKLKATNGEINGDVAKRIHEDIAISYIIASYAYGRLNDKEKSNAMLERAAKHIRSNASLNNNRRFDNLQALYNKTAAGIIDERVMTKVMQSKLRI
jgi:hypothetical protein